MNSPLDPPSQVRRALAGAALDRIDRFIDEVGDTVAFDPVTPPDLLDALAAAPSDEPGDVDGLMDLLARIPRSGMQTGGPGHLAYIPNGGIFAGAVGAFFADAINRYTGVPLSSQASVQLEAGVVNWMTSVMGLPPGAGGLLLSGGSIANLSAVVAARTRLGEEFSDGVVYVTEHVHHSITKAARIAGFPERAVRIVASDPFLRMDVDALVAAIAADRSAGRRPCLVVGSAGTTNTGAIDPLAELGTVSRANDLWFHADGAYGGFFALTDRGRRRLAGIGDADSITVDPHKALFLPYGVGALLVRDPESLRRAHAGEAAYMRDVGKGWALPSFDELGPELTRPFRGVQVWLPLHLHGVAAFRGELDRMLDLAEHAERRLRAIPGIAVPWSSELSVVAFRGGNEQQSASILEHLNASKRVVTSSTIVEGRLTLRLAMLSPRTDQERLDEAIDIVANAMR